MRNEEYEMKNEKWRGMIVIADDITGAAEIAGIAFNTGQQVRLLCADGAVCCDLSLIHI